ncbi:hypothetical protein BDV12DRAFT_208887 [Aspergillus spectabilis]
MAGGYRPVTGDEQESEPLTLEYQGEPLRTKGAILQWLSIIFILLLTNFLSFIGGYSWHSHHIQSTEPQQQWLSSDLNMDTVQKQFQWTTAYSSKDNKTQTDELWESIQPSHGFVAIDQNWAESHGWPESMYLPSDRSKGVYLLEAYHYLHCLKIIRKTFWEAVNGEPYTHTPGAHMNHCFDALRQYVICSADTTPLYTFGDFTAGDGQVHRCKNWSQLRDYATKHTACYRDSVGRIPLGEHFGFCDDGNDGVVELS